MSECDDAKNFRTGDELQKLFELHAKAVVRIADKQCCLLKKLQDQKRQQAKCDEAWSALVASIQSAAITLCKTELDPIGDVLNNLCFDLYEVSEREKERFDLFTDDKVEEMKLKQLDFKQIAQKTVKSYQDRYNRFSDDINMERSAFEHLNRTCKSEDELNKRRMNLLEMRGYRLKFLAQSAERAAQLRWQQAIENLKIINDIQPVVDRQEESSKNVLSNLERLSDQICNARPQEPFKELLLQREQTNNAAYSDTISGDEEDGAPLKWLRNKLKKLFG